MVRKFMVSVVFWLVVFLASSASAEVAKADNDFFQFRQLPPLPANTSNTQAVWVKDKILALGGLTTETDLSQRPLPNKKVYQLDEQAGQWQIFDELSFDASNAKSTVMDDSVFFAVAMPNSNTSLAIIKVDAAADQLEESELPSLPVFLREFHIAGTENQLYIAGISTDSNGQNQKYAFVLDLLATRLQWHQLPAFPSSSDMAPLMAGLYGKVYLFTADGALALKDGNWKEYAPSQTTVVGRFAAPCGHAHVLFFGDDSQKILAFHTVTGQWVEDWQLPQKLNV